MNHCIKSKRGGGLRPANTPAIRGIIKVTKKSSQHPLSPHLIHTKLVKLKKKAENKGMTIKDQKLVQGARTEVDVAPVSHKRS